MHFPLKAQVPSTLLIVFSLLALTFLFATPAEACERCKFAVVCDNNDTCYFAEFCAPCGDSGRAGCQASCTTTFWTGCQVSGQLCLLA